MWGAENHHVYIRDRRLRQRVIHHIVAMSEGLSALQRTSRVPQASRSLDTIGNMAATCVIW